MSWNRLHWLLELSSSKTRSGPESRKKWPKVLACPFTKVTSSDTKFSWNFIPSEKLQKLNVILWGPFRRRVCQSFLAPRCSSESYSLTKITKGPSSLELLDCGQRRPAALIYWNSGWAEQQKWLRQMCIETERKKISCLWVFVLNFAGEASMALLLFFVSLLWLLVYSFTTAFIIWSRYLYIRVLLALSINQSFSV